MKLTAENVSSIFIDCYYKKEKSELKPILVDGVKAAAGFASERIEHHKLDIESMIDQLPNPFKEGYEDGGGWTFLNMCNDKTGEQWTGIQNIMDQLYMLGNAIGKCKFALEERHLWPTLPGGMPFIIVMKSPPYIGNMIQVDLLDPTDNLHPNQFIFSLGMIILESAYNSKIGCYYFSVHAIPTSLPIGVQDMNMKSNQFNWSPYVNK